MIARGPDQLDPYPPLDPAPWWSVLEPFSPLEVLIDVVLVVLALAYLSGVVMTLVRTGREIRGLLRQRARARSTPLGVPARVTGPSWVTLAVAVLYGVLLAVVWPGPRLAYWALGEPG